MWDQDQIFEHTHAPAFRWITVLLLALSRDESKHGWNIDGSFGDGQRKNARLDFFHEEITRYLLHRFAALLRGECPH